MKTYTSASIRITNRPGVETERPALYIAEGLPLPVLLEIHTQAAYSALVEATEKKLTPEHVRQAINTALQDTFLNSKGKILLAADIEAMHLFAALIESPPVSDMR